MVTRNLRAFSHERPQKKLERNKAWSHVTPGHAHNKSQWSPLPSPSGLGTVSRELLSFFFSHLEKALKHRQA